MVILRIIQKFKRTKGRERVGEMDVKHTSAMEAVANGMRKLNEVARDRAARQKCNRSNSFHSHSHLISSRFYKKKKSNW